MRLGPVVLAVFAAVVMSFVFSGCSALRLSANESDPKVPPPQHATLTPTPTIAPTTYPANVVKGTGPQTVTLAVPPHSAHMLVELSCDGSGAYAATAEGLGFLLGSNHCDGITNESGGENAALPTDLALSSIKIDVTVDPGTNFQLTGQFATY
jgi:hypothetical protein